MLLLHYSNKLKFDVSSAVGYYKNEEEGAKPSGPHLLEEQSLCRAGGQAREQAAQRTLAA